MRLLNVFLFAILGQLIALNSQADTNLACQINQELPVLTAKTQNLNPQVLQLALTAYNCAVAQGFDKQRLLTVIDYSLPDTEKRLWVIDLNTQQILFNSLVAHGQGSGDVMAKNFSDFPETHESSIGLFLTGDTYIGHDGYALRIFGLEKGFNDNAYTRNVVIHGAPYVSDIFVKRFGKLGRSWGCPAVPLNTIRPLADTIKNGTLVFAYYPNSQWLQRSHYLNCSIKLTPTKTKSFFHRFHFNYFQ